MTNEAKDIISNCYIYTKPCIDIYDAEKVAGVSSWMDFDFPQLEQNDHYVIVGLDDETLEDKYADLAECEEYNGVDCPAAIRVKNDIKFIEAMRKLGYREEILVFVNW